METKILRANVIAVVALIIAGLGWFYHPGASGAPVATSRVSVYDRVVKAGEMRASYANYPPYSIKDANSGQLSGIFVDTLNEMGRRLGLKVNWVEEVGFGDIFQGLNSNRHDIFGAGVWKNSSRAKVGDFSRPAFFNVIKLWGRTSEKRSFQDLRIINEPSIRIAAQDGAIEDIIAKTDYPKAGRVTIPQASPWSDNLLNITTNKADITFAEPAAINLYLAKNPGTLKELAPNTPIRVFGNSFAFKLGEPEFKSMIDSALEELQQDGTLDKIISKYEKRPGEYYRPASAFATK